MQFFESFSSFPKRIGKKKANYAKQLHEYNPQEITLFRRKLNKISENLSFEYEFVLIF